MDDPAFLAILIATFTLAGLIKGVIGLGLPTVVLGLITVAADLTTAMVLLLVPSFATNVCQGVVGGHLVMLLKRLWVFLLAASITVALGAAMLARIELPFASALLGGLMTSYAVTGLMGWRFSTPARVEPWAGPVFGAVNGVFTGLTGSFVVPGVMYLQSLGFDRSQLVQSMGILFTVSTVALAIALEGNGLVSGQLGWMSAAGLIPAFAGMTIGQRIRSRLSEAAFRRLFLAGVLLLGVYILVNAVVASA